MIKRENFKRFLCVAFWLSMIVFAFGRMGHAGTAYYVDATSGSDSNAGTSAAAAWKTVSKVNSFSFSTGDDVYFKCGETWSGVGLVVDWNGTAEDNVIIGAYYSTGTLGVSGAKPIIKGNYDIGETVDGIPSEWYGLVHVNGFDYIHPQNLNITNSGGIGVNIQSSNGSNVTGVDTDNTYRQGISFAYANYGEADKTSTVTGCTSRRANGVNVWNGTRANNTAGYAIGAIHSQRVNITGCTVYETYWEGIGIYATGVAWNDSGYGVVENNVLYDNKRLGIYLANVHGVVVRGNLVYGTTNTAFHSGSGYPGVGIYLADECQDTHPSYTIDCELENNYVYNNFVAHTYHGILFRASLCPSPNVCGSGTMVNSLIANNTIVDCYRNIEIVGNNSGTGSRVINNIFFDPSLDQTSYVGLTSHPNMTFANNFFNEDIASDVDTSGILATAPGIVKESGWTTLTAGSVDETDFYLTGTSVNIDSGAHITTISATEGSANTTMPVTLALFAPTMKIGVDNDVDGVIDFVDTVSSVDYSTKIVTLESTHTYTENGKIYLQMLDSSAFAGAMIDVGANEYNDYPNQKPVIVGPGNMMVEPTGLTIDFQATVTDADGDDVTVVWDFTTSGAYATDYTGEDPGERAIIDPETYPTTYVITITATDAYGLVSTHSFNIEIIADSESTTCQEYYAPSLTADINASVSRYNTVLEGFKYQPAANVEICSVYVYHRTKGGTPTNDVFIKAMSISGTSATALLGNSSVVADTSIENNSWVGPFVFSPPISVASGTTIALALAGDNDGNLDDAPEYSGTNYYLFGADNENNGDSIQVGTQSWLYAASFPYTVGTTNDAEDDMVVKIYTMQAAAETVALQDIVGVTPNGTYKEGDTIQVALQFNIAATLTDADSDTTKDMTLTGESGDGTDITLTHSSPAFGVASSIHYFTGTVPAGASTSDLTITSIDLNGDAIGGATLTINAGHNLDNNADIVFDTSTPTISAFYYCTSDGTQVTADTDITAAGQYYVCLESDGDSFFFADGPLGNLSIPLVTVPAVTAYYYSGIGTSKLIFYFLATPGVRGTDIGVSSVNDLAHGATKLTDQGGNEITYTLPNTWLINANALDFAIPKTVATGTAWWVPTNMATDAPATVVDGDHFILTAASDTFTTTNDNLFFDLPNQAGTYAITFNGDNCTVMGRYGQTITVDGTGTGNKVVYIAPWR